MLPLPYYFSISFVTVAFVIVWWRFPYKKKFIISKPLVSTLPALFCEKNELPVLENGNSGILHVAVCFGKESPRPREISQSRDIRLPSGPIWFLLLKFSHKIYKVSSALSLGWVIIIIQVMSGKMPKQTPLKLGIWEALAPLSKPQLNN